MIVIAPLMIPFPLAKASCIIPCNVAKVLGAGTP